MCFMDRKSSDESKVNELVLTTPNCQNVLISHVPELGSSKPVLVKCMHTNPLEIILRQILIEQV